MGQSILRDGTTPVRKATGAEKACLDHPKGKRVNIPAPGHGRSRPPIDSFVSLRFPFFFPLFGVLPFGVARSGRKRGVIARAGERWTRGGDALALGDAGGGPGKSFLFLLRDELPGTESFGARDSVFPQSTAAPAVSEVPSPALENPRRVLRSPCRIVPISASGLQG